jgi:hypothetical protein
MVLAFSSLPVISLAHASNLPAPEFTVKLASYPYDVPTTYTTNEYTGQNITHLGYHVENSSIEIWTNNQPYGQPLNGDDVYYCFFNVREKGHFGENWKELYYCDPSAYSSGNLPPESSSEYTVLALPIDYPSDSQVDFQVQASVWHYTQIWIVEHPMMSGPDAAKLGHYEPRLTLLGTSDWSKTQTLTLESPPSQTTPDPPQTEATSGEGTQQTQQPSTTLLTVVVTVTIAIALAIGTLIYVRKRKHIASA